MLFITFTIGKYLIFYLSFRLFYTVLLYISKKNIVVLLHYIYVYFPSTHKIMLNL